MAERRAPRHLAYGAVHATAYAPPRDPAGAAREASERAVSALGMLADPDRLRTFAAVALGAGTPSAIARQAALGEAEVARALTRLLRGGLLAAERDGLRVASDHLAELVRAAAPERPDEGGGADPATASVLRAFLREGRLTSIPATRSKRLVVLDHVARVFEIGVRYPERDVDVALRAFHGDYAALRRHLVDEGFLSREGGVYWRTGGSVTL